jgi:hypothetical protein
MSLASKIRDLKLTVTEQNQMIIKQRQESASVREVTHKLYLALVKYKVEHTQGATAVEEQEFPPLRGEDLTKMPMNTLVGNIGTAFNTVIKSLSSNREEVRAMLKEFDAEIDEEMEKWQRIRAEDQQTKTAEFFRENIASSNAKARPETPDTPLAGSTSAGARTNLPPTPPESTGKKDSEGKQTGQPKSPTTTFEKLKNTTAPNGKSPFAAKK